ncbi:MAG: hypothetical protein M3O68_09250 [Thermoproteota archaeon]|nr:hypothetical protein [Thermoproteota archaeon]
MTIHDGSPEFKSRLKTILRTIRQLKIPFNIAVIPCMNKKKQNDIRADKDFLLLDSDTYFE